MCLPVGLLEGEHADNRTPAYCAAKGSDYQAECES